MVTFVTSKISDGDLIKNVGNRGYSELPGHPGCSYLIQPPKDYQDLFQDLQKNIRASELPIGLVRIPHATLIQAKIIGCKPTQNWKVKQEVQRVCREYYLYCVHEHMEKTKCDYQTAVHEVLKTHEKTFANITSKSNREDALGEIPDPDIRKALTPHTDVKYQKIKESALESINAASFSLKIQTIKLTNTGVLILLLSPDDRLLQLRIDLILAGQGLSKWPRLSGMKNAWTTVGYFTKVPTEAEKESFEALVKNWMAQNQDKFETATVQFNVQRLGALAFRTNDFYVAKKALFPIATLKIDGEPRVSHEDLRLTPKAGEEGITPIAGKRKAPFFGRENWNRRIDEMVVEPKKASATVATPQKSNKMKWLTMTAIGGIGLTILGLIVSKAKS